MPVGAPTTHETLQSFMAAGEFLTMNADLQLLNVPQISIAAPTVYDVKSGLDFAPGAAAALDRWLTNRTLGAIVGGVASHLWPGPGSGESERTSISEFTAGAADLAGVQLAVPTIVDAQLLAAQSNRTINLTMYLINNAGHVLPLGLQALGAGRVPLRYRPGFGPLNVPYGEVVKVEIEFQANAIGYVRMASIGKPLVPLSRIIDESRGSAASGVNINQAGYYPYLVDGDLQVLFTSRNTGTSRPLPAAPRGFAEATGTGLTSGGVANGVGGSKVALSTIRGSSGQFDLGATVSNQNHVAVFAFLGLDAQECRGSFSTGTNVTWHAYSGIPRGGKVLYFTAAHQATGVVPTGGVAVHSAEAAAQDGYTYRTRIVEPDANGNVAPPATTLSAAVTVDMLSVCLYPKA